MKLVFGFVVANALLCCQTQVLNAQTTSVFVEASFDRTGRIAFDDSGEGSGNLIVRNVGRGFSFSDSILDARAYARAAPGELGTKVTASSERLSNHVGFDGTGGQAGSRFTDTLTITSSTIPIGTPVTLHFAMPVDGIIDIYHSLSVPDPNAAYFAYASVDAEFVVKDRNNRTGGQRYRRNPAFFPDDITGPFDFLTAVGETIGVTGGLDVAADSEPGQLFIGRVQTLSDFAETARFYAESLTPGITLVSASGHDYAFPAIASVPEPSMWAMLAGTGSGLLWLRRRKTATPRSGVH